MNRLEQVYDNFEKKGIEIFRCRFKNCKSICSADGFIGIDPDNFESSADLYTDAIHNEGHFNSGAFYYASSPYSIREQAEYRADKAAAQAHVPPDALREYMRQGYDVWEIADAFGVTPEFIWRAYTIYKENMGLFAG